VLNSNICHIKKESEVKTMLLDPIIAFLKEIISIIGKLEEIGGYADKVWAFIMGLFS